MASILVNQSVSLLLSAYTKLQLIVYFIQLISKYLLSPYPLPSITENTGITIVNTSEYKSQTL